ncbi:MAG TPA: Gldg family protein [Flavobacteriales bacterium]|nr:Gldg family protein [Flavobacteriales bacterium]HQW86009.1 Gldg family protein [Flavobacteriales bacterium]
MRTKATMLRFGLLFAALLVLLNLVGSRFHVRLDLTGDQRYTLSKATRDILKDMPEAATITGYFTEELPPDLAVARDEFRDLLVEYAERSGGNVVYEMIDPAAADSLEQQALESGIRPLLVNTREKDKAEQIKAFMGAVVRMGDQQAVIPVVQPGSPMEWELSSRIKEVSVQEKPVVGIMQGHGEPSVNAMAQAMQGLSVLYSVEPMAIYDTMPVHGRFRTIAIIDPADTISPMALQRLEEFMARGGGVVIAFSNAAGDLQRTPLVEQRTTGLDAWLARHGLHAEQDLVTDAQCGQVQVMQQRGFFNLQTAMAFPYFPLVTRFGEHPVASGLEAVVLQFARSFSVVGDSTYRYTPLLTTSDRTGSVALPHEIDLQRQWSDADFTQPPRHLAFAIEGPFGNGPGARLVVIGSGNFAVGAEGGQLNPDNVNLLVNAVDWVSDQTGLIDLRGKGVNYRPIEELSEAERSTLKWSNLLLPILLVIAGGVLRMQWRRRQRKARTAPGHVE